ncbi:MAG: M6 family metalloprotease domain-containing protein [bacterium]
MFKIRMNSLGLVLGLMLIYSSVVMALEPPRKGELEQLAKEGKLKERVALAKHLGNNKIAPGLLQKKLNQFRGDKEQTLNTFLTPPSGVNLGAKGIQKTFILLIEFPDYLHTVDSSAIYLQTLGDGSSTMYPYDSLKNYYLRSSYGMLTIQGVVFDWYRAAHNRSYYGDNIYLAPTEIIKEALTTLDATHDFSQYDNDGDGYIDYFMVFWTGPDTGWMTLWWGFNSYFNDNSFWLDGRLLTNFSWQWESNPVGSGFDPNTPIHETGHALGLPDYYDYDNTQGPDGGIGDFDMMDSSYYDHNAFSKWILDWITPTVINAPGTDTTIILRNSAQNKDCVAIMPGMSFGYPFTEFYLVQNRSPIGNDADISPRGRGLAIWHVDATLWNNIDFRYNNSNTDHKLLRLMEADGLEEIEKYNTYCDPGDFYGTDTITTYDTYVLGTIFSTYSFPSSCDYTGATTGIIVSDISSTGTVMNARFRLMTPSSYQHQLSGYTLDTGGNPVKNIPMQLTGRTSRLENSTISGNYIFDYLAYGTYTVAPNRNGYRFIPTERTVSSLSGNTSNINFVRKYGLESDKIKLCSRSGGSYYGVAIQGNYAYVAEGGGLSILQISNNTSFQLIYQIPLEDVARKVTVSGNYVYVGDNYGGFYIIDISNPTAAHTVGQIYIDQGIYSGMATDIAISGNYAYVLNERFGLKVIDINDPTDPYEVGHYIAPNWCYGIKVVGNYAYLACFYQGLFILDISNPATPKGVGQCLDMYNARDVAISGKYAYVADEYYGLVVVDIDDPLHPYAVGTSGTSWELGLNVTVSGSYAYLADEYYGLQVIDISDPNNLMVITSVESPGFATGLAKSGNYLYMTNDYAGINVLDVSVPSSPSKKGNLNPPGIAYNAAISGNYAYVAGYRSGLRIYDISDPDYAHEISRYTTTYYIGMNPEVMDVAVKNQYAYVANALEGIAVLNISNPATPFKVGEQPWTYGIPYGIYLRDTCLFIAQGNDGLGIMNISDPTNPHYMVETTLISGRAYGVTAAGNYAYLATGTDGLRIYNISNISNPVSVGHYSSPTTVWYVAVSGNYAYLAGGTTGLIILDISTPSNPVEISRFTPAGNVYGVKVVGEKAYLAADTAGLRIIDISNPAAPTEVAYYDNPDSAWGVAVDGFTVVELNENGGVWFFQYPIGGATKVDDRLWMLY